MHDPLTVAFQIRYPWRKYGNRGRTEFERQYRETFITIWHRDPGRGGSDDSCGWFKRAWHGNQETLSKIRSEFNHSWDSKYSGWFDSEGKPLYSPMAIALGMFRIAAWVHFKDRRKSDRFMQRHLYDILSFAENPVDSMLPTITSKYGIESKDRRVEQAASVIYGCILRWEQRWWQHPRCHVHHWRIQIHPWQQLRRRYWERCCKCGKRGFPKGVGAMGDWSGTRVWHDTCDEAKSAVVSTAS